MTRLNLHKANTKREDGGLYTSAEVMMELLALQLECSTNRQRMAFWASGGKDNPEAKQQPSHDGSHDSSHS